MRIIIMIVWGMEFVQLISFHQFLQLIKFSLLGQARFKQLKLLFCYYNFSLIITFLISSFMNSYSWIHKINWYLYKKKRIICFFKKLLNCPYFFFFVLNMITFWENIGDEKNIVYLILFRTRLSEANSEYYNF